MSQLSGRPYLLAASLAAGVMALNLTPASAQAPDCTYDRCALQLRGGFWGVRVLHGRNQEPIARVGLFSSRISVFATASDSVQWHYRFFRSRKAAGTALQFLGLAATTVGLVIIADQQESSAAGSIFVFGGLGLSVGGSISLQGASNHLSQAIWWYNRGLPNSP